MWETWSAFGSHQDVPTQMVNCQDLPWAERMFRTTGRPWTTTKDNANKRAARTRLNDGVPIISAIIELPLLYRLFRSRRVMLGSFFLLFYSAILRYAIWIIEEERWYWFRNGNEETLRMLFPRAMFQPCSHSPVTSLAVWMATGMQDKSHAAWTLLAKAANRLEEFVLRLSVQPTDYSNGDVAFLIFDVSINCIAEFWIPNSTHAKVAENIHKSAGWCTFIETSRPGPPSEVLLNMISEAGKYCLSVFNNMSAISCVLQPSGFFSEPGGPHPAVGQTSCLSTGKTVAGWRWIIILTCSLVWMEWPYQMVERSLPGHSQTFIFKMLHWLSRKRRTPLTLVFPRLPTKTCSLLLLEPQPYWENSLGRKLLCKLRAKVRPLTGWLCYKGEGKDTITLTLCLNIFPISIQFI